ncbi:hypothetical protein IQ07DRAFT_592106 [Pyrenochaeta sp. DS3sAY3a]|nr:hypothetical protein IQ07DRAFT_592106 [Pyrenochaeta sp. DS3sAY3a]
MKFIIVAFLAAVGANAAALERRVDPGCPASMPFQVSPPYIHLCTAYDLSYENACDRDGRTDRGYRTCQSIGPLA